MDTYEWTVEINFDILTTFKLGHYYTKMLGIEFPNNWLYIFFSIESSPASSPPQTPQNLPTQQDTFTGLPTYVIILTSILTPLLMLLTIVAAIVCIWRYKKKTQKKCIS